ncbi:hypothetical protein DEJ50_20505 [Streptomyces venezuelae]|uniref:DUF4034 domain-containing protein n=1 Tax=Streptomyces venezuelae TaxID=54571 RepID=A0A5P2D5M3_STRVZ|nr:hypothetical protein [Streptomyces venezuelae]QES49850.1 hypothetical protein DEJ50_20505 [Streptomyces venezuelae]
MIGLYVLGLLLLGAAWKVGRGMYYLRKAKRLEAETAVIVARTEETKARTAATLAEQAAEIVAQGFVPEEQLDTENLMPVPADRTTVVAAIRSGDWQAGADWIEAAGRNWGERNHRVGVLATEAAETDTWLLAWQAARPGDPTAAVVSADAGVTLAWNVRGAASARHTTQEQFRLFHTALIKAQEAVHEAQRLADPADPVPYIAELRIGRGLAYSHDQFRDVWTEVVQRAPKVQMAWLQAQQFWCEKWCGTHELAEEFGREAVKRSEPGDLLSLIELRGYFERENRETDLDPDVYYKQPEIVAAATAALADLAAAPDPAAEQAVRLRHMLAWILYWQDRYEETVEQFRHIDGYCGIEPWMYQSGRKASFLKTRDYSVRQVTGNARNS